MWWFIAVTGVVAIIAIIAIVWLICMLRDPYRREPEAGEFDPRYKLRRNRKQYYGE